METYEIRRGDSFNIPFYPVFNNQVLPSNLIRYVEITIGELTKTFDDGVLYRDYTLLYPLTEEDTYGFIAGSKMHSQVRMVLNPAGNIVSFDGPNFTVKETLSTDRIGDKIRIR